MKVIYIAGPFRGPSPWQTEQNVRVAEELALEVWRLGVAVICPHTNTRFFQGAAADDVWLKGYLELLKRCDALLCTPRWDLSFGAREEVAEARKRNLPVFFSLGEVRDWLTRLEGPLK